MPIALIVIIIVIVLIALIFLGMYNSLIAKRNEVKKIFGSMDAMLKKRYDLIPNLVSSVKTYMKHEENILTKITELRSKAINNENISDEEKVAIDNEMRKLLGSIRVAVENYPDLKSNQNFLQLQASLNEVEEQISASRRAYNSAVTDYNNAIEMFPTNIMAGMMSLKKKNVFEISERERENVDVDNLFNS